MRRLALLLFSLALPVGTSFATDESFAALTGIPAMEGLAEVPDTLVVFDKEEGRIVEASFRGEVEAGEAAAFYRETLYQLGWALKDETPAALGFAREGERLVVEFAEGPPLTLRFRLGPEP